MRDEVADAEMFGPYRIEELIGRGGMGEVHRAYDTAHDRHVALKRLSAITADEEYRVRFRRESRIVARLRDPHVIPIHAFGEIDGQLYLDMRLVEGQDLGELLRAGRMNPHRAVDILSQVAQALDAAHADGLVHRDVKPSNILIGARDFAYLADFGIAQSTGPETTSVTAAGHVIGSFDYIAPERLRAGPVDGRADVYSLACVLYVCLTGRAPFGKAEPAALITSHLTAFPPPPSLLAAGLPPELDAVIARGMAKDPSHRYPTADALMSAAALAMRGPEPVRIAAPTGQSQLPPTAPPPGPVPPRRGPLVALVLAVLTVVAVAAALILTSGSDNATAGPGVGGHPAPSSTTRMTTSSTITSSTTIPKPPVYSAEERQLRQSMPSVYRGNPTCVTKTATVQRNQVQATARVLCTSSNTGDIVTGRTLREPRSADFVLFASARAAEDYFVSAAKKQKLTRDDRRMSCIAVGHDGKLYGSDDKHWLTCFRSSGSSYLVWVDLNKRMMGELRGQEGSLDAMRDLYMWWNMSVLGQ